MTACVHTNVGSVLSYHRRYAQALGLFHGRDMGHGAAGLRVRDMAGRLTDGLGTPALSSASRMRNSRVLWKWLAAILGVHSRSSDWASSVLSSSVTPMVVVRTLGSALAMRDILPSSSWEIDPATPEG